MRARMARIGLVLVVATFASATGRAQKAATLTALDYEEIRNLYGRYTHAFDAGDGQAVANVYTPDGAFVTGGRATEGREKLAAMPRAPMPGRPSIRHLPANIVIDPAPGGAKGMAYVMVLTVEAGKPPVFAMGGLYEDVIVKTSEGWRFKRRTFTPWNAPPAASAPAPAPR